MIARAILGLGIVLAACGEERPPMVASRLDAGRMDAGREPDAGVPAEDAGTTPDAGRPVDAGPAIDAGPIPDAGPPPWAEIPGPATPRARHLAVRLADGRVLVAGGTDGTISLASAELFDPATSTWSGAGVMPSAHERPTATLLADGRVLVAGGLDGTTGTSAAAIYTPVPGGAGSWAPAMAMPQRRSRHAAVRLGDGRVLICGGDAGGRTGPLASCIAYDPAANAWTASGMLPMPRLDHTASLLPDGMRVLLAGGRRSSGGARLSATDVWASGTVGTGPSLETARAGHRDATLPDGRILVVGGWDGGTIAPAGGEEIYDPVAGTWSTTARFAERFDGHTVLVRTDGVVAVIGGWAALGFRSDVELYTPATPRATAPSLPFARAFHTATELEDGTILVAGGYDSPWFATASAHLSSW